MATRRSKTSHHRLRRLSSRARCLRESSALGEGAHQNRLAGVEISSVLLRRGGDLDGLAGESAASCSNVAA
jgi:hypothetical protein